MGASYPQNIMSKQVCDEHKNKSDECNITQQFK